MQYNALLPEKMFLYYNKKIDKMYFFTISFQKIVRTHHQYVSMRVFLVQAVPVCVRSD